MKRFLAITLALAMILSVGIFSFAADEVTGKLADGTEISKPVSEVVKSAEDYADLASFFEKTSDGKTVYASGVVDFGGFFNDVVTDTVDVPLAVAGVKVGDKVRMDLSDGTGKTIVCMEDGVIIMAFPKDAAGIGFVATKADATTWWELPPEKAAETVPAQWVPHYDADGNLDGFDYYDPDGKITGTVRGFLDEEGRFRETSFDWVAPDGEMHTTTEYNDELYSHETGTYKFGDVEGEIDQWYDPDGFPINSPQW